MKSNSPVYLSVEEQRQLLRGKKFRAEEKYKILHIGRYAFGETDIVNRMKQALENLGHIVFDLNTDEFKKVIDNPNRFVGGHGPVEIKLELIKPILKNFEPQIIICNAGGYVFSEEDSLWLKEQGHILIGITLSDPDVFTTTQNYVHRFDYHFTNAIEAIQMYKDQGITNTLHFPFAIDRSFVEAEAVDKPQWKADVICIGNAANRPDRNEFMNELNKHFNVKVYGTGWEIEGAFSVKGDDFYSAARAGKFHVNFPGTRAGYTNVKIGVFETIANGGILCTEYFDEMNKFFEYDKEIIGYKDVNDLRAKLDYYLNHPEEAEEIRRRAFDRLVREHLWESRWEQLFALIRSDINQTQKVLPKERYQNVNLQPVNGDVVKVIVQGYYGAKNSGDDLILESISLKVKEKYPQALIMVAGFNRENITLLQGFFSLPRTDIFRMEKYIKDADLVIYGGGGILNDYTFNNAAGIPDYFDNFSHGVTGMGIIPTMAAIHEVPVMYFALGVGPLENEEARKFVRFLSRNIDLITVRDDHSKNLLDSVVKNEKKVILTADPTYVLPFPDLRLANNYLEQYGTTKNDLKISVSLRAWKGNPSDFVEKLALLLDQLIEKTNAKIIFLPFQFGTGNADDNKIHRVVQEHMTNRDNTIIYENNGDYDELLSILATVDAGINMRLHGSILSNSFGVPTIGFNYDDKVKGQFESVGLEEYLIGLDFDPDMSLQLALQLIEKKDQLKQKINERMQVKRQKANENFDYVYELLEKGIKRERSPKYSYPRNFSLREQQLLQAKDEVKEQKREVLKLKKELLHYKRTVNQYRKRLNLRLRADKKNGNELIPQNIDLSKAVFTSENKHLKNVVMPIAAEQMDNMVGIRFSNLKAPKKGDFSKASINMNVEKDKKYNLSLTVHSPYENRKNKGRIRYEILIDGKLVYKEDISKDGNAKDLTFEFTATQNKATLELVIVALKDCEEWSWGSVAKTFISDVTIIEQRKTKSKLMEIIGVFKN